MMATPAVMSAGGEQDSVESSSLMLVADAGMCRFAFDVLHAQLEGRAPGSPPESIPDTDSCAVFVTWKKQSKDGKKLNLRGCIGTLTPISLHEGLVTYTISAAFRDRRFQPISLAEVEELEVLSSTCPLPAPRLSHSPGPPDLSYLPTRNSTLQHVCFLS